MNKPLVLLALFIATATHAQNNSGSSVGRGSMPRATSSTSPSLQFKVGAGLASMSLGAAKQGETVNDPSTTTMGLNISAMADLPVSNSFSITSGLGFIQKGYGVTSEQLNGIAGKLKYSAKINYLEVPVLAKLSFGEKGTRFNVNMGPYVAFKMGSSGSASFTPTQGQSQDIPVTGDQFEGWSAGMDFGLRGGAGVDFPMSENLSFLVGAEYDFGLKNIAPENSTVSIKTRALMANVGMGMKL